MLSYGRHGAKTVFQSGEHRGRRVVRKLPLAAVGLTVWKGRSLEAKRPGGEGVGYGKSPRERGILASSDLLRPPAELVDWCWF